MKGFIEVRAYNANEKGITPRLISTTRILDVLPDCGGVYTKITLENGEIVNVYEPYHNVKRLIDAS